MDESLPEAILRAIAGQPEGVPTEEVCRRLGRTPQGLGDAFEQLRRQGKARGFAGLWFSAEAFNQAAARFLVALKGLHEAEPEVSGHPMETVAFAAGLPWTGKPLDRIVAALAAEGELVVSGLLVRDPAFRVRLSARQRGFLERVKAHLEQAGVNVPSERAIAKAVGAPVQAVAEVLRLGCEVGEIVRVAEGVFYTKAQIEGFKEGLSRFSGGKPFRAAQVRDALGTTRKYAIPLLEHLDDVGFTSRSGDLRTVNSP